MPAPFVRYEPRTTDLPAARAFYEHVLGAAFADEAIAVAALPPDALARGARPGWLGHVAVADVTATTRELVARGAQVLGAAAPERTVLRDAFGARLALVASAPHGQTAPSRVVAWHVLHTTDGEAALALYTSIFGWTKTGAVGSGDEEMRTFSFDAGGPSAGSTTSFARKPEVHAQWLYCFATDDLDAALARVVAYGGTTLGAVATPLGARVAGCDDVQGAAFALWQR